MDVKNFKVIQGPTSLGFVLDLEVLSTMTFVKNLVFQTLTMDIQVWSI